jgi:protein-L-isoaspartate(D-aspartate) O-methyltransferase
MMWLTLLASLVLHCGPSYPEPLAPTLTGELASEDSPEQREAREHMVREQIEARGVHDAPVLGAMRGVPRHLFVPAEMVPYAYADSPLPIGYGQTISQPYIVAFMSEALELKPKDKVLEIGTGSGYQAAILGRLAREVYSIEIIEPLATQAADRLARLGFSNVRVRAGDGYRGWPEAAPFDAIIVTAAPDHVPQPLIDQLRVGGRLVLPLGRFDQELVRIRRAPEGPRQETLLPVRFVPMVGEAEKAGAGVALSRHGRQAGALRRAREKIRLPGRGRLPGNVDEGGWLSQRAESNGISQQGGQAACHAENLRRGQEGRRGCPHPNRGRRPHLARNASSRVLDRPIDHEYFRQRFDVEFLQTASTEVTESRLFTPIP